VQNIPLVAYLALEPEPHLVAKQCCDCGARYFDRRSGCASCYGTTFEEVELPRRGAVRTFTIVHAAAPGIEVPFIAAVVDLGGTSVRTNIVDCPPEPDHVSLGMPVELATFGLGVDHAGAQAIGYGFRPVSKEQQEQQKQQEQGASS
jgi:uncharacterized OB-fold protein